MTNAGFTSKFAVDLDGAGEASVARAFAGGVTTWTVTHNIGNADLSCTVKEISSSEEVVTDVVFVDVNRLEVKMAGSKADNLYRVTIIG